MNPEVFNNRQEFDRVYEFQDKPPQEQQVLDQVWEKVQNTRRQKSQPAMTDLEKDQVTTASEQLAKDKKIESEAFEKQKSTLIKAARDRVDLYEERARQIEATVEQAMKANESQVLEFQSQVYRQLG